jgi:DNA polymerase-3 subunit epsilon
MCWRRAGADGHGPGRWVWCWWRRRCAGCSGATPAPAPAGADPGAAGHRPRPAAQPQGHRRNAGLAEAVNELAAPARQLARHVAEQVAQASRACSRRSNRLAALMAELTQSVVVCNLDGRILLYNNRARLQFRALSESPHAGRRRRADRHWPLDLRRVRPQLVAHALESIQQRWQRGAASPSAQFVTTTRAGSCCACRWRRCARRHDGAPARRPQVAASC